jgi:hypothetical protein|tara:strand:- start:4229 stop:4405 length:177 start_codon:yes stop_codon:yes gene_type:complete
MVQKNSDAQLSLKTAQISRKWPERLLSGGTLWPDMAGAGSFAAKNRKESPFSRLATLF